MMNKKEKKELYFLEQDIKRITNKLTEHEACLHDFIETCRKPYHNEQEIVIKELDNQITATNDLLQEKKNEKFVLFKNV